MSPSSDSDASPPRRPRFNENSDSDASPPRRSRSIPVSRRSHIDPDEKPPAPTNGKGSEEDSESRIQLSAYHDDRKLNDALRKRSRWGDPMAAHLQKKKPKTSATAYRGPPAPPNRFGIQPGPHWDGEDRSNGFENRLFEMRAARQQAKQKESAAEMYDL